MKKYLINIYNVETKKGYGTNEKFDNSDNEAMQTLTFDSLEEAKKEFAEIKTGIKKMSGYCLHTCKVLEWAKFNDNGDWVEGDWISAEFPENEEE